MLSEDQVLDLVTRARAGDSAARAELIAAHVGMVVQASRTYRDQEEAMSAGQLKLVQAADEFIAGDRPANDVSRFLRAAIEYGMLNSIRSAKRDVKHRTAAAKVSEGTRDPQFFDVEEAVLSIACSEQEVVLLKLKMGGLNDKEAAQSMRVSPTFVNRMMSSLRKRWLRRENVEKLCEDLNT
jgi:DNA-directed RNA polymerase specialized sigma24 family protein